MEFIWDPDKNALLQRTRGLGFEVIVTAIMTGGLVANMPHPHRDRYPHQRVFIVAINNYAYVVPCIVTGEVVERITLFPSRKATRDYLERVMHSGALTYRAHRARVMPAHAGIQEIPGIWIPASAGMTCPPSVYGPSMCLSQSSTCVTRSKESFPMMHGNMPQEALDKQAEIEHTLDDYERELLQAIEAGQLAPIPGPIPDKVLLEKAARKTLAKSERLTIRLTRMDLQTLKHCAAREGVPYHTLISSVLHKYVTGQLVPQQAPRT